MIHDLLSMQWCFIIVGWRIVVLLVCHTKSAIDLSVAGVIDLLVVVPMLGHVK